MVQRKTYDVLIVGGGAAGFFTAINCAVINPKLTIAILERGREVLTKVRISGGGRCNVTHAEFTPKELSKKYPRGEKELLGPFHHFMTGDTIAWFEERGVALKTEEDGRMFPMSDSSQTIIHCFMQEVSKYNIDILKSHVVQDISACAKTYSEPQISTEPELMHNYTLKTNQGEFYCNHLVVTTGSNPKMWQLLKNLGHTTIPAVPSLFTFNIKDRRIEGLMGLSSEVSVKVINTKLASEGPLLITHWGMSGPAILKLSAWGARELALLGHTFEISVNWLHYLSTQDVLEKIIQFKQQFAKQSPHTYAQFDLPKRLWQSLLKAASIDTDARWADLTKIQMSGLAQEITQGRFRVSGKSTFKEEFVTAGGVALKEVNFKTFESKICPNMYLAGEVLNIDAITGGFNFQNAWTGGFMAAQAIVKKNLL